LDQHFSFLFHLYSQSLGRLLALKPVGWLTSNALEVAAFRVKRVFFFLDIIVSTAVDVAPRLRFLARVETFSWAVEGLLGEVQSWNSESLLVTVETYVRISMCLPC